MTLNTVLRLLRTEISKSGGEAKFARDVGVSRALVYAVLSGIREPRGKLLDAIGIERVVVYRRKQG